MKTADNIFKSTDVVFVHNLTDLLSKIKDCFDVILLYLNFSMEFELCLSVPEELVLFRYRGSESSQGEVQPRVQGC